MAEFAPSVENDPGCVKTLGGITAPGILGSTVMRRAKKTQKFVFRSALRPNQILFSHDQGRVEMWRGGCRLNMSVAASFDWRCLSGSTMAPFPHPAHRTGQADFPHPALGQDFTPLLSRATPSAVSEHSLELIGCPISMSFTTYCVCLELRSLPSTGITRPHWYYEPLRHPGAPGLSLAGVRLVIADRA